MRKIKAFIVFLLLVVSGVAIGAVLGISLGINFDVGTTRAAVSETHHTYYIECKHCTYAHVNFIPDSFDNSYDTPLSPSCNPNDYIRSNSPPPTYMLDDVFSFFGTDIAVFFKNTGTGFIYMYNPDKVFFGASLSKITHALYVYTMAERGLVDMYAVHTFTAEDFWGGTGILRFKPAGTRLTTRELLGHSVIYSCNVAFRMLVRYTAGISPSFNDFANEIGADTTLIRDIIAQNTSARDMGLWMYAIFNYLESDSRYTHYFMSDLLNTVPTSHHYFTRWEGSFGTGGDVNVRLLHSDFPMARKYGWSPMAFHEAAIMYGASPYILVVLSNKDRGAHYLFEEISWLMQGFNAEWF